MLPIKPYRLLFDRHTSCVRENLELELGMVPFAMGFPRGEIIFLALLELDDPRRFAEFALQPSFSKVRDDPVVLQ